MVLFIIAIATVALSVYTYNLNIINERTKFVDITDSWINSDGDRVNLEQTYNIDEACYKLGEIKNNTAIAIDVINENLQIYIDEKIVYSTPKENTKLYGKSPGSYFVTISLDKDDSNKTVKLKFNHPYTKEGTISNIYLGDSQSILQKRIYSRLPSLLTSLMIMFIGMVLIILYLTLKKISIANIEIVYLAVFAIVAGIVTYSDDTFLQIFIENTYFYNLIKELFMMLVLVPLLLFLQTVYKSLNKQVLYSICLLSIIVFLINYMLNSLGIADYKQSGLLTNITYFLTGGYLLIINFKCLYNREEKAIYHSIGVITMCVLTLVEIIMYQFRLRLGNIVIIRIGVLIFLIMEGIQLVLKHFNYYVDYKESQMLSRLAYEDGLTQLANRTKFMEDIEELPEDRHNTVIIFMMDVNNLKEVNDKFGHLAGDELLKESADIIRKTFEIFGSTYRIGGDEFTAIVISNESESVIATIKSRFRRYIDTFNKTRGDESKIHIAIGYSIYNKYRHNDIQNCLSEADKYMYANKKKIKDKEIKKDNG